MHDFIQSQSFSSIREPFQVRPAAPEWVQRGIMRSFGEDNVLAPFRSGPAFALRRNRRRPRSATPLRLSA
ncbi:hypothetical protein ESB00_14755 [Oleiharenicola lentus]|jgi:hypothetical protein|uniref:Uncharacterized protein n=1 Tax=Oleiharenicola lentus TaxID=2508720 RepID=A0A4Q1C3P0_9BACT|nr:hypothetical protein [Oleiharenicola lentus]RXK52970.1 hypothetical protein ESB00_14755 [Oleiharenicola lentus]